MNSYFKEIYDRSAHLRPTPNYPVYPPYHKGDYLEEYFLNFYIKNNIEHDRILIPVLWTNCYVNNNVFPGNKFSEIQVFLSTLDPNKKYFTVSQHDDAIMEILPKDTITFSAGGNNGQVPIPLICSRLEDIPVNQDRDIFCSFVGSLSHPFRNYMFDVLKDKPGIHLYGKGWSNTVSSNELNNFTDITSRSKFALCPRGYGKTSFRLYEAMQLGAIPVYFFDHPWLPFQDELRWEEFCILIGPDEVKNIPSILASIPEERVKQMQQRMIQVYEEYFTLESMCKRIIERI